MAIERNFAMSPEEMCKVHPLPPGAAWMSCHFSPDGLSNLPESLPPGGLLIVDDSIPYDGQPPQKILDQLTGIIASLHCQAVLMDLQRPNQIGISELLQLLEKALPCPVGVSEFYGSCTDGPVFLPLLPAHKPLEGLLQPWSGREIWLEVGPAAEAALVTGKGTEFLPPSSPLPDCPHRHEGLLCHYGIQLKDTEILFTLIRTAEDLRDLTKKAESLGVTRTIGLYQELF